MSETVKRAAEANERRGAEVLKRAEEMQGRRVEWEQSQTEAGAERDDLSGKLAAVNQAAWPYYGLFPEPLQTRLHVIPCGMWRYQVPITPALESMTPPSPEADPNYAILSGQVPGGIPQPDSQAADDVAKQRAEAQQRAEQATPRPEQRPEQRTQESGRAHPERRG